MLPESPPMGRIFNTVGLYIYNQWLKPLNVGYGYSKVKRGTVAITSSQTFRYNLSPEEQPCQPKENTVLPDSFT